MAADDLPVRRAAAIDRRQRAVHRAAQRTHDALAADPARYRISPSTTGALVLAIAVLSGGMAGLAALVWATLAVASGYLWIPFGAAWIAALFVAAPRPHRLPDSALLLSEDEQPALLQLVQTVAVLVGVEPPRTIAVTTGLNAAVTLHGWWGRPALILGLPLWTLEDPDQRVGTLAHELGHLKGRDLLRNRVILGAYALLLRVVYLLGPDDADELLGSRLYDGSMTGGSLLTLVQQALALPFRGVLVTLTRLLLSSAQHREYLADRRGAEIVGTIAMRQVLAEDLVGIRTRIAAGVGRGEDPFDLLDQVPAPDAGAVDAYARYSEQQLIQADATHPPDHLRLSLLATYFLPPSAGRPDADLHRAADREMRCLRDRLRRQLVDALRTTWM